eukprot:NODE_585_length_5683_cov_0.592586.p2 type:complete len:336 gc:universal NODE_585_length_5683_cov_0.592586:2215-3222(+)
MSRGDIMEKSPTDGIDSLELIRNYLKRTTWYDCMSDSTIQVTLDANLLLVKGAEALLKYQSLGIPVVYNGYFKAMLGTNDILLLMHYLYHHTTNLQSSQILSHLTINSVFELPRPSGLQYLKMSLHPDISLFNAASMMLKHNQFRACILEIEPAANAPDILHYLPDLTMSQNGHHSILSVITNYRILKNISKNCQLGNLNIPAKQLMSIPQYTATMQTTLIQIIEMLISSGVNAIPILDENDHVINVYGSPDILQFVADHTEFDLNIPIEHVLQKRARDFEGVHLCSEIDPLGHLIQGFQYQSIHRILVTDENKKLLGIVRLVDIIRFLVLYQVE